jgi:hypothetical protein
MNFNYHEVLVKTRNALNFRKGNMHLEKFMRGTL